MKFSIWWHCALIEESNSTFPLHVHSGADMDAVDQDSCTPLLLAATFGRTAAFQDLMESQASLYAADKDRKSCVFLAAEHNHIDILRVWLLQFIYLEWPYVISLFSLLQVLVHHERGAKLCGGTDTKLNTPLHIAAMKGNLGAMKVSTQYRQLGLYQVPPPPPPSSASPPSP